MTHTRAEVEAGIGAIYRWNGAGCCLHIVVDDFNWQDHHVEFCIEYAKKQGHPICEGVARGLLGLSKTQRIKAIRNWEPA